MRIVIVTLTTTSRKTGVAEYLINLIDGLQRIDKHNHYYIITGTDNSYMFEFRNKNFIEIKLPLRHEPGFVMRPLFHLWQIFFLPIWCWIKGVDLVHLPNTMPVTGVFPTISTIHDVAELKTRKYSRMRTYIRMMMVRSSIRNSKEIITVSESSAVDLRQLGAKKVIPIHLGFRNPFESFISTHPYKGLLDRFELSVGGYILYIGTLLKHKNVPILLVAFEKILNSRPDEKLVLVGAPDNDYGNIVSTIEKLELVNSVKILKFVSQEEKLILLKNAKVFVLISSYEGFGIPILEAQSAGVPVIVNNISSLPEIGGSGVLLVDPANLVEDTASKILQLLSDSNLRQSYINKGFVNLHRFSWDTFASKTWEVYQSYNLR